MTGAWANVDGWIGPAHEARVSPVDAGFLYGEAVYENLRTYGHVPFLFARHLVRLRRSAEFLGIPLASPTRRSPRVCGRRRKPPALGVNTRSG